MFWRSKWVDACHSKLGIVMFHVINHLDPGWLRPGWGHFANCRCNKSHVVALAKQNREESRTSSGGFSWSTSHSFRIDQSTQIKIGDISLTYPHLYIHLSDHKSHPQLQWDHPATHGMVPGSLCRPCLRTPVEACRSLPPNITLNQSYLRGASQFVSGE
jgi:hypothetical protein